MAKYALVLTGGSIENVIEATPSFISSAPPAWLARYSAVVPATADAEVGGTWTGSSFIRAPRFAPPAAMQPRTLTGDYVLTADDDGVLFNVASAFLVVITVPAGLPQGLTAEFVQAGAGQVSVSGSGGLVIQTPTAFVAATATTRSSLVVTVLPGSTTALVRGDLSS
jgi:hypothetical protein